MTIEQAGLLDEIASWATSVRLDDLPTEVVHHAKRSFLDFLGVTLRGAHSSIARQVRHSVARLNGADPCSVLGADLHLSPAHAALANGTAAFALELDDGHTHAHIHPGATCIPAIVAIGEWVGSSTRALLESIVVAYEISCRLGIASAPELCNRGFHGLSTVGVFGATAGAAKLLGVGLESLRSALSLAGVNAGGFLENTPSWLDAVRVQVGRTNADGVLYSLMASEGIAGPSNLFESSRGWSQSFLGRQLDRSLVTGNLGTSWSMLGTYVKLYPFCRSLHSAIDAAQSIAQKHEPRIREIREIRVETARDIAEGFSAQRWSSPLEAQWSLPFAVAITLCHGSPHFVADTSTYVDDPQVHDLAKRVHVRESGECNCVWPDRLASRVTVLLDHGTHSELVITPRGEPALTLSDSELESKFRKLTVPVIGYSHAARIAHDIWLLDEDRPMMSLGLGSLRIIEDSSSSHAERE